MFRKVFSLLGCLTLALSPLPARAQADDDAARVTLTINPDGSKTVYRKDALSPQATATTTGANGKAREKIIYKLDNQGRYESGEVFAANGALRFKTRYQYDAAGRLAQEIQLGKDDSVRSKIVYAYDAAGRPTGYAVYDGGGKLLGRTTERKPAANKARAGASPR